MTYFLWKTFTNLLHGRHK